MLGLSIGSMERLAALMQDILTYSELTAAPRQRTLIALEESLQIALANLQLHIENNQAEISMGVLPDVAGDRTQLAMVFQNLIGNVLKYRSEKTPRIHIEAAREDS
jgi:chemotaxis family two-component system sensor kinase Cph1